MTNIQSTLHEIQLLDTLFADAQEYFALCLEELRAYGIEADPNLEVRRSTSMQSYYNLADGHIYLAIPDLRTGVGRFYKMFLKTGLAIEDDGTLLEFMRLFMPRLIAHELGHHLRHRYGMFRRENLWHEEQVANQLAMSLIKRRMPTEDKQRAKEMLAHAIEVLGEKMEAKDVAIDSYRNIVYALNATKQLGDDALDTIELMRSVFSIDAEALLRASGQLPEQVIERIQQRDEVIDQINDEYTSDAMRYLYYHLGWMYCDLLSQQSDYPDEFAIAHLGLSPGLLPEIDLPDLPERIEIRALFRAYQDFANGPDLARRFFYKRYRASLLKRLESAELDIPTMHMDAPISQLMEVWDENSSDPLAYLELIAPPELKRIFPTYLSEHPDSGAILPDELPSDTDRRLWSYFKHGMHDEEAENTVARITVLENTPMLRAMPAEVQLWLAHRMYRLKLESGDPVLWKGEKNSDIYILTKGQLEILTHENGKSVHLGKVSPGMLFGEMSFITREARSATVRAIRPSECYVLKGSDLRPMAFNHPAMLVQMATTLADKLNTANQKIAHSSPEQTVMHGWSSRDIPTSGQHT